MSADPSSQDLALRRSPWLSRSSGSAPRWPPSPPPGHHLVPFLQGGNEDRVATVAGGEYSGHCPHHALASLRCCLTILPGDGAKPLVLARAGRHHARRAPARVARWAFAASANPVPRTDREAVMSVAADMIALRSGREQVSRKRQVPDRPVLPRRNRRAAHSSLLGLGTKRIGRAVYAGSHRQSCSDGSLSWCAAAEVEPAGNSGDPAFIPPCRNWHKMMTRWRPRPPHGR